MTPLHVTFQGTLVPLSLKASATVPIQHVSNRFFLSSSSSSDAHSRDPHIPLFSFCDLCVRHGYVTITFSKNRAVPESLSGPKKARAGEVAANLKLWKSSGKIYLESLRDLLGEFRTRQPVPSISCLSPHLPFTVHSTLVDAQMDVSNMSYLYTRFRCLSCNFYMFVIGRTYRH